MLILLFFIICFGASIIGSICGIGGGVIIKPVLDLFGVMDVATISFFSGCTVLSMTAYSVVKSKSGGKSNIDMTISLPLAIGASFGGVVGKMLFQFIVGISEDKNKVGAIQAACLFVVTIGTLCYTVWKNHIKTYQIVNKIICLGIGISLGFLSSFLGIGGGPINLVVLFFFFSMNTKEAAENSLYIIFFSQVTSIIQTIVVGKLPEFSYSILLFMVAGGVTGGSVGRKLNTHIKGETVDKFFIGLMIFMLIINAFNIYQYL